MFRVQGEYAIAEVFVDTQDDVTSETLQSIHSLVNLKAFDGVTIRIMPDVHAAGNIVVGFSAELTQRVPPEVVGGDIGCGLRACRVGDTVPLESDVRDEKLRQAIPSTGDKRNSVVKIEDAPFDDATALFRNFSSAYKKKFDERISPPFDYTGYDMEYVSQLLSRIDTTRGGVESNVGTLGGGNHFFEISRSKRDGSVWLVTHTGSRTLGRAIAKYWIDKTNSEGGLGWLENEDAHGYLTDMLFAQQYAKWNREQIMMQACEVLDVDSSDTIDATHNYIDFTDLIIRKGATRSYDGERFVIPMDMQHGTLVCEGVSNENANWSAPHGSGRLLKRSDAKQIITKTDLSDAVDDVYVNIDETSVSEAPQAYKSPDFLLEQLSHGTGDNPLAIPIDHLIPVHNIKY